MVLRVVRCPVVADGVDEFTLQNVANSMMNSTTGKSIHRLRIEAPISTMGNHPAGSHKPISQNLIPILQKVPPQDTNLSEDIRTFGQSN